MNLQEAVKKIKLQTLAKKLAGLAKKDKAVAEIVTHLEMGHLKTDMIKKLRRSVQDDVVMAMAEVLGPEETTKLIGEETSMIDEDGVPRKQSKHGGHVFGIKEAEGVDSIVETIGKLANRLVDRRKKQHINGNSARRAQDAIAKEKWGPDDNEYFQRVRKELRKEENIIEIDLNDLTEEQLDELSMSVLGRYIKKSAVDVQTRAQKIENRKRYMTDPSQTVSSRISSKLKNVDDYDKNKKRTMGIGKAVNKIVGVDESSHAEKMKERKLFNLRKKAAAGDKKAAKEVANLEKELGMLSKEKKKDAGRMYVADTEKGETNIIMQLRSAQDLDGVKELQFRRGTGTATKDEIDFILKLHDQLNPEGKRRLRIQIWQSMAELQNVYKQYKGRLAEEVELDLEEACGKMHTAKKVKRFRVKEAVEIETDEKEFKDSDDNEPKGGKKKKPPKDGYENYDDEDEVEDGEEKGEKKSPFGAKDDGEAGEKKPPFAAKGDDEEEDDEYADDDEDCDDEEKGEKKSPFGKGKKKSPFAVKEAVVIGLHKTPEGDEWEYLEHKTPGGYMYRTITKTAQGGKSTMNQYGGYGLSHQGSVKYVDKKWKDLHKSNFGKNTVNLLKKNKQGTYGTEMHPYIRKLLNKEEVENVGEGRFGTAPALSRTQQVIARMKNDKLTKERKAREAARKAAGAKTGVSEMFADQGSGSSKPMTSTAKARKRDDRLLSKASERMRKEREAEKAKKKGHYSEALSYGKVVKYAAVMKKIKDGDWEASTDVKPGRALEIRDNKTGKKTMIRVD